MTSIIHQKMKFVKNDKLVVVGGEKALLVSHLSSFVLDPLDFKQRHGKLFSILSADVVEGLLSVLVQFYDPLY